MWPDAKVGRHIRTDPHDPEISKELRLSWQKLGIDFPIPTYEAAANSNDLSDRG
jgi:hypothetical protein